MSDLTSDLNTILQNVDLDAFRSDSRERFGLRITPGTQNSLAAVKMAIQRVYSDSLKKNKKEGPYPATCLMAYVDPTGIIPKMGKLCKAADARPIIKVIAKPHGLFPTLPLPVITNPEILKTEKGENDRMIYAMYPVFYGDTDMHFPKPGDEIEVDFEDTKNMIFGKYLKFLRKSVGKTVQESQPGADGFTDPSKSASPLGIGG